MKNRARLTLAELRREWMDGYEEILPFADYVEQRNTAVQIIGHMDGGVSVYTADDTEAMTWDQLREVGEIYEVPWEPPPTDDMWPDAMSEYREAVAVAVVDGDNP